MPNFLALHSQARYRYLSTSRGAGNTDPFSYTFVVPFGIAPYLPREGPETACHRLVHRLEIRIAPYLPREGPETKSKALDNTK